jgi:hypothetical protein
MFTSKTIAELNGALFDDVWHDRPRLRHDAHGFREHDVADELLNDFVT